MTGTSTELAERLQQRQAQQLAKIEQITTGQLQQLASSLTQQSAAALSTTKNDIKRQHEQLRSAQAEITQLLSQTKVTLAELNQLSCSESSQIREGLTRSLKAVQVAAISESTKPLQESLKALKSDATKLQRLTVNAWLKPLITGGAIGLGLILAVTLGTLGLDAVISSRVENLSQLRQQLIEADQLAKNLPVGVRLQTINGRPGLTGNFGPLMDLTDGRKGLYLPEK